MIDKGIGLILFFLLSSALFGSGDRDREDQAVLYNRALQLYKSEKYEESGKILTELDFPSDQNLPINRLLLQSALEYRIGEKSARETGDFTGALLSIEKSIGFLKRALELDKGHNVAANNLEMAMKMKEMISLQKETEQKNRQDEDSLQNELDQLKKDQQNLAEENRKESSDHRNQQSDLNNRTESLKNSSEEGEEFKKHMENAERAQQAASEALENGEMEKAGEYQNQAVQHLENAAASISGNESDSPGQEDREEVDRATEQLIQSIIESEKSRTEPTEDLGSGIAVERNW